MPSQNSSWNTGHADAAKGKGPAKLPAASSVVKQTYDAGYWAKKQAQIAASKTGKK